MFSTQPATQLSGTRLYELGSEVLQTQPDPSIPAQRFILTRVGEQLLVFPNAWVAEVMLLHQTKILSLPFYPPALLGVVHHQGNVIPLVHWRRAQISAGQAATKQGQGSAPNSPTHYSTGWNQQGTLTVIRLNHNVPGLPGVGVVVDVLVGGSAADQSPTMTNNWLQFQPEQIPPGLWQPQG